MTLLQQLNVTPDFSFSTLQTSSDIVNALIISLLTVFIVSNILSVTSELIFSAREKSFEYSSWVRSFLFVNSNDPISILSWIWHRYSYKEKGCTRYRYEIQLRRLALPLLVRLFILVTAIASVAISIPSEKRVSGCEKGDFRVQMDPNVRTPAPDLNRVCVQIPLTTTLGEVRSFVSYCSCLVEYAFDSAEGVGQGTMFTLTDGKGHLTMMISVMIPMNSSHTCDTHTRIKECSYPDSGAVPGDTSLLVVRGPSASVNSAIVPFTTISSRNKIAASAFYIQWVKDRVQEINDTSLLFTNFYKIDSNVRLQVIANALRSETGQECNTMATTPERKNEDGIRVKGQLLNCDFDVHGLISRIQANITGSLTLQKPGRGERDNRLELNPSTAKCAIARGDG